jgi:MoxR-like ATPase
VNCHQTTETSDLIGSLRPVRGRSALAVEIVQIFGELIKFWPDRDIVANIKMPSVAEFYAQDNSNLRDISEDIVIEIIRLTRDLCKSRPMVQSIVGTNLPERNAKRQKLDEIEQIDNQLTNQDAHISNIVNRMHECYRKYNALFEWSDGPLVRAMKAGEMILLDEISLADDAVLERLNSVLEPSRTFVLAEKGCFTNEDCKSLKAHDSFQLFATMNPGGDFGKRELSPALRSRFTEIWIPPVTDMFDIDLALDALLSKSVLGESATIIKNMMMDYVQWFNEELCTDPMSSLSEHTLSLRDIMTWARFTIAASQAENSSHILEFYVHGARLMHLDGLGVGTGLSSDVFHAAKQRAEFFLRMQVEDQGQELVCVDQERFEIRLCGNRFGVEPFWIASGPHPISGPLFNFDAPTASLNAMRILRAMQLRKPILLEGAPGVGKTSLVSALAAASGHRLIRINLSEQTDMADLIGSDLPVPNGTDSDSIKTSFRWFDGVLLSAIKNGDWVLLDELNLASQSVLEGLNSCLDHRASVYVPELGCSITCPLTFRIFAAQNPLAQGGGRKGLPKSFLNRFTKVFIDTLSELDLQLIVSSKFDSQESTTSIIAFNSNLHNKVVNEGKFGLVGAPWEFNLRDVFRWCELHSSQSPSDVRQEPHHRYRLARDLYFQRFRTEEDRQKARSIYFDVFDEQSDTHIQEMYLSHSAVRFGDVDLVRKTAIDSDHFAFEGLEFSVPLSLLEPYEAVARCVAVGWPCLLVGPSASGKTTLIRSLAALTNSTLKEIALSSSSDVSELVGCFEQVGRVEQIREVLVDLHKLVSNCILKADKPRQVHALIPHFLSLQKSIGNIYEFAESGLACAVRVVAYLSSTNLDSETSSSNIFEKVSRKVRRLDAQKYDHKQKEAHFAWKDGLLVEAMREGYWLHLQNANLCSSSVLDRLNPVMEPGGFLLLAECGTDDDSTTIHREIRCHADFRIFLSMNPEHGEVSRAMRNRCVEISLLDKALDDHADFLDKIGALSLTGGIRSSVLASAILHMSNTHCKPESPIDTRNYSQLCSIACVNALLRFRGLPFELFMNRLLRIFSKVLDRDHWHKMCEAVQEESKVDCSPSFWCPSVQEYWALSPCRSRRMWLAQPLRNFITLGKSRHQVHGVMQKFLLSRKHRNVDNNAHSRYLAFLPLNIDAHYMEYRDHLISLYLSHFSEFNLLAESSLTIYQSQDTSRKSLRFAGEVMLRYFYRFEASHNEIHHLVRIRLFQSMKERLWVNKLQRRKMAVMTESISLLEASYYLSVGFYGNRMVQNPLIPILYTFFRKFDAWIDSILRAISMNAFSSISDALEYLVPLSEQRDMLWSILNECRTPLNANNGICLDDSGEFIVQWMTFRNFFRGFINGMSTSVSGRIKVRQHEIVVLIESIESLVLGHKATGGSSFPSLIRFLTVPLVPRRASHWQMFKALKSLYASSSIMRDSFRDGNSVPLDLQEIVLQKHPFLFTEAKTKRELLGAISTILLSSTQEIGSEILGNSDYFTVFHTLHSERRDNFVKDLHIMGLYTVSNDHDELMDVNKLEELRSSTDFLQAYERVGLGLLSTFSTLQVAPCAERWCEQEELFFIRALCQRLLRNQKDMLDSLNYLLVKLRRFITVAVSTTQWNVSDILPYNILLWSFEAGDFCSSTTVRLVQSLLPKMFSNAAKRTWSNSSSLYHTLSLSLEFPFDLEFSLESRASSLQNRHASRSSVQKVHEHIPTELLISLVADVFRLGVPQRGTSVFATIENYKARELQLRALVENLGRATERAFSRSFPHEMTFLLTEILEGAKNIVPGDILTKYLKMARDPGFTAAFDIDGAESLNCIYHDLFQQLLMPLLRCFKQLHLRVIESSTWSQNNALAKVYLGLLRFHLLKPDSPLDPGQEPIAKIAIINRRLQEIGVQLEARRHASGYRTGNFSPSDESVLHLLDQGEKMCFQKSSLQNRVIERDCQADSFSELYRETLESSLSGLSLSTVLRLVRLLTDGESKAEETVLLQVDCWQTTTAMFCDRLLEKYSDYEDVVSHLIGAIGLIKDGIGSLVTSYSSQNCSSALGAFSFLAFPSSCSHSGLNREIQFVKSIKVTSRQRMQCKRAAGLAILSRLVVLHRLTGMGGEILCLWKMVQDEIFNETDTNDSDFESIPSEDAFERELRDQFPDHQTEFRVCIEEQGFGNEQGSVFLKEQADFSSRILLDDIHLEMIAFFHKSLFSRSSEDKMNDALRVRMFRLSFDAAFQIFRHVDFQVSPEEFDSITTSHIFALAMASPSSQNPVASEFLLQSSGPFDFHRDPNPSQARDVADVLWRFMARVSQLLNAFPGNEVLSILGRVSKRVLTLDLQTTPMGKLLSGLEALLRHAQDWEQHASERVMLGESLKDVARVVHQWRKMELQYWSELLLIREKKHAKRALIFWTPLCKAFSYSYNHTMQKHSQSGSKLISPNWVWRGIAHVGKRICSTVDETSKDILEIMKTVDTFCLTSTLGDFHARISILEAFSDQLMEEAKQGVLNQGLEYLPQFVRSLLAYYKQFLPFLAEKLRDLRLPFEKRLEQEVKLAKWDDQTYFAVAESSERNHRKLMRVLREYDEVLGINVMTLLESELSRGVRLATDGGAPSGIPCDNALFSFLPADHARESREPEAARRINLDWAWTDTSRLGIPGDEYSSNIKRYARKMNGFRQNQKGGYSSEGNLIADEICRAIFNRIDSLRSKNVTRPMKERALVDLFRELRSQGFCATKWSVPHQIRSMESVLHLPFPQSIVRQSKERFASILQSSEHYYQRCLAESSQFRKETSLIASEHMTRRQLDKMLAFCDHGALLLAQQRCILASIFEKRGRLSELICSIMNSNKDSLELSNTEGHESMSKFASAFTQSLESIRQLILLINTTIHLLPEKKSEWCKLTVTKLQCFLSSVKNVSHKNSLILTCSEITDFEHARNSLKAGLIILDDLKQESIALQCFPPDAFDVCLTITEEAINYGNQCFGHRLESNKGENGMMNLCTHIFSTAVKAALQTVQTFMKGIEHNEEKDKSIWDLHRLSSSCWATADLQNLISSLEALAQELVSNNNYTDIRHSLAKDVVMLFREAMGILDRELQDFFSFFRSTAKLQYVLIRIFRVLAAQGFCSEQTNESKDGEGGENDMPPSMNSENGTGMGEGEGGRDITDEIESEEQLLGLKNEHQDEGKDLDHPDSKKLGKDEAEKGMEMEGEFEGDLYDLPENDEQSDMESEKGEVDREMGEEGSPTGDVIDEKLWDEDDNYGDDNEVEEEKFEKNSAVQGAGSTDEMITKEENSEEDPCDKDRGINQEENDTTRNTADDEEIINNDHEDNYEENQGAEVRDKALDSEQPGDHLELGDDDVSMGDDGSDEGECLDNKNATDDCSSESNEDEPDLNFGDNLENSDLEATEEAEPASDANLTQGTLEPLEETAMEEEEDHSKARVDLPSESNPSEGLGLKDLDGNDMVDDHIEDEANQGAFNMPEEDLEQDGKDSKPMDKADGDGSWESSGRNQVQAAQNESVSVEKDQVPNPLKSPGDASKFWHRRLKMLASRSESENSTENLDNVVNSDDQLDDRGSFEYSGDNHQSASQVLGEADEENAIYPKEHYEEAINEEKTRDEEKLHSSNQEEISDRLQMSSSVKKATTEIKENNDELESHKNDTDSIVPDELETDKDQDKMQLLENDTVDGQVQNQIVSELSQLREIERTDASVARRQISTDDHLAVLSITEIAEAQSQWAHIQNETYILSRRLCEKLRLVLEPLVASKLRGDYRTGKRINMKRVIGYIASGYRKDKIWLRRTKPAKRNYRILLAVDDSESMKRSGAGDMALRAMATLAVGMSQLEVGEVGIASFGDSMNLIHPFSQVFTSQSGTNVVQNFHFNQQRTRTALCLESVLMALKESGNNTTSMQLVFMISDGRIERDSRSEIRRLIREMIEQNILLVLIIVEGLDNKKDSIIHMKEVIFEKGKPKVKQFIEDYPFPYYIVLSDTHALPEVLGDALRQWFEMLTRLQLNVVS